MIRQYFPTLIGALAGYVPLPSSQIPMGSLFIIASMIFAVHRRVVQLELLLWRAAADLPLPGAQPEHYGHPTGLLHSSESDQAGPYDHG